MPTPRYDESQLQPLVTDDDLLTRAGELIGPAIRRQTWMLFLDHAEVQLPILMPIDDIPELPFLDDEDFAERALHSLAEATGAASIVVVLERPGGDRVAADDALWAAMWHRSGAAVGVTVRATLLSHDDGVRWIAPDDF